MADDTLTSHQADRIEKQIGQLSQDVQTLAGSVSRHDAQISTLVHAIDQQAQNISKLFEGQTQGKATNWQAVGVGLTLAGLIFAFLGYNMSKVEKNLDNLAASYSEHVKNGHPWIVLDQVKANRERLDRYNERAIEFEHGINDLRVRNAEEHGQNKALLDILDREVEGILARERAK